MVHNESAHKAGMFKREIEEMTRQAFGLKVELAEIQIITEGILRIDHGHLGGIIKRKLPDRSIVADEPRRDRQRHDQSEPGTGHQPFLCAFLISKPCENKQERQYDQGLSPEQ